MVLPGRNSSGLWRPKRHLKTGLKRLPKPTLDADTIDWVEKKAKGLGNASYRVAEMTDQAREVRKAVSGD
jgi:hypothetical protein